MFDELHDFDSFLADNPHDPSQIDHHGLAPIDATVHFGYAPRELPCGHEISCTEQPHASYGQHGIDVRFGSESEWEYWGGGVYYERAPDGGYTGNSFGW